jgi:hypothetical protein
MNPGMLHIGRKDELAGADVTEHREIEGILQGILAEKKEIKHDPLQV